MTDTLFQVHWQNPLNPSETEFVAQADASEIADVQEYIREIAERRKGECPDGWVVMVCDSGSKYFVWP